MARDVLRVPTVEHRTSTEHAMVLALMIILPDLGTHGLLSHPSVILALKGLPKSTDDILGWKKRWGADIMHTVYVQNKYNLCVYLDCAYHLCNLKVLFYWCKAFL